MKNKRQIIFDAALNITAAAVPIAVLQLLIYPAMARRLGDNGYGLMVTLVSLLTLISVSLGNVLNNVRLLRQNEYAALPHGGDFNRILLGEAVVNAIAVIVVAARYEHGALGSLLLTVFTATLLLVQSYISVCFRLELNYRKVLFSNLILILGFGIGYLLFLIWPQWQLVYLSGYLASTLYILRQHNLLAEPFSQTELFRPTLRDCLIYAAATLCAASLSYVDKLMLYPMLGGAMVSVYYSATIMGKICAMAITPISSVMLSYLAKMERFRRSIFFKLLLALTGLGTVGYFACLWISGPLLQLLYPEWAADSMRIIRVVTLTAMVTLISSVLNPIVLRFCRMGWQALINVISLVVYIVGSLLLVRLYGLAGFSAGVLISCLCKLALLVAVFLFSYGKNHSDSVGDTGNERTIAEKDQ